MDLLALLLERLGEGVVRLDDGERLDEERLARARLLVDDPGDALAPVGADGQAVAPPLLRHVAVGEDVGPRAHELLEPPHDVAPQADDRGADRGEARGGRVADPAVGLEDDVPLREEVLEVAERGRGGPRGRGGRAPRRGRRAAPPRSARRGRRGRGAPRAAAPVPRRPSRRTSGAPSSRPKMRTGGRSPAAPRGRA